MSIINIVREDNMVIIDGDAEEVTYTDDPTIHSITWDDVALIGEIEFSDLRKRNETIDDFTPYQHFVGDHERAKVAREAAEAVAKQQVIDDQDAENVATEAADEAAMTQQDKRYFAYPDTREQLYALHQARQGNTTALDVIDTDIATIDIQFPL